ncbi:hypothetical protein HanIR_Chr02g0080641 [Helianthus annuus]|nr:hypothetical protein HanIR_Chr02g0080641 [Helianthus annuus]
MFFILRVETLGVYVLGIPKCLHLDSWWTIQIGSVCTHVLAA